MVAPGLGSPIPGARGGSPPRDYINILPPRGDVPIGAGPSGTNGKVVVVTIVKFNDLTNYILPLLDSHNLNSTKLQDYQS